MIFFTYLYSVIIKQNDPFNMYTLTETILPIILASIFIYWVGTIARLLIHLSFNKD